MSLEEDSILINIWPFTDMDSAVVNVGLCLGVIQHALSKWILLFVVKAYRRQDIMGVNVFSQV